MLQREGKKKLKSV